MHSRDLRKTVMSLSLVASLFMLAGKLGAYFLTSSAAIFSDACESLVHGLATALAAFSLWYADQPPDQRYLYGHGKIVYFSAGFEGALILVAAGAVLGTAIKGFFVAPQLRRLSWGLAITGGLGVLNLFLGLTLVSVGRRQNALVLVSNGKHVLSDMWTSLGAVVGLGLVWLTGVHWFDPITALLIGFQILYTAFSLLKRAYFGLMDRADPRLTGTLVRCLERAVVDLGLLGFHQLRHRASNDQVWVEVHLLVPGKTTTERAHDLATATEDRIRQVLTGSAVNVTSHVEPADHTTAHPNGHRGTDPIAVEGIIEQEEPAPR